MQSQPWKNTEQHSVAIQSIDLRGLANFSTALIEQFTEPPETSHSDWPWLIAGVGNSDLTSRPHLAESQGTSANIQRGNGERLGRDPSPSLFDNEWLTTHEAAKYLRISIGSLKNMSSNGQVRYYKLGRRNRYWLPDLRKLLLSEKRGS